MPCQSTITELYLLKIFCWAFKTRKFQSLNLIYQDTTANFHESQIKLLVAGSWHETEASNAVQEL